MPTTRDLLQSDGSLRCPRCGGTQFSERHSTGRKVAFGFASLLGSPNQVQCVACGTKYARAQTPTLFQRLQPLQPPIPRRPD